MNYKVCGVCGLDFESFRLTKELGCPECYSAFEVELKQILTSLNVCVPYKGSLPKKLKHYKSNLANRMETKLKLEEAIKNEEYEKAALYRDYLKAIESKTITNGEE